MAPRIKIDMYIENIWFIIPKHRRIGGVLSILRYNLLYYYRVDWHKAFAVPDPIPTAVSDAFPSESTQ